jgi:hypothetical protein
MNDEFNCLMMNGLCVQKSNKKNGYARIQNAPEKCPPNDGADL